VTNRRLATRLVTLAAAQMVLLAIAAVIIWYFTIGPHGPHHHHEHEGGPPGLLGGHEHNEGLPEHVQNGPIFTLFAGLVIMIGGAIMTARWIVRPIEKLSRTTRSIGEGNLAARSGLIRNDEIGELGEDIDDMAKRIERLVASERELLANVAHELRTPLARIGVALDLAAEGDGTRARASLEDIAVDCAEIETIVDDILTAARFELGRSELQLRRAIVEPSSIAANAADRLRARHPERTLEITVAPSLPEIDVDPMLFRRVVDNLLENAHKYTPDSTSPIKLDVTRDDNQVVFSVADRGVGIAAEDLPNVFTAFFRAERSRSRETGGVGLGLTLARRIADAHGGTVSLESQLGEGTIARVTVPVG
jgi:two-component system OmpR family sensor kinase